MRSPLSTTHVTVFTSSARPTSRVGRVALLLFSVAVLMAGGATAVRGQFAGDGFDPKANGLVRVVVVQPDGKILIGGDFTALSPNGAVAVTRNHIARLNPDGTLDTAFNPNASSNVNSIAVQADGKILVGGGFNGPNSIGGQTRNFIARLDATTGLADSFDPNANGGVYSIVVQPDGKILAGGDFNGPNSIGGAGRNRIARLDATAGLADSFNPNSNNTVFAIAVQADGKILAGGFFQSIGGQTRFYIARLDATTGLADSLDPHADGAVASIAVQADGKILAGGDFFNIGGQARHFIARLDATTGLADSFDPHANNGAVLSIAVQADGKLLVGGCFFGSNSIGGQRRNYIARLDPTTGLADSFDPNAITPNGFVYSIAVQADGKVLAGGDFTTLAPNGGPAVTRNRIARLETDGRLDQTLDNIFGDYRKSIIFASALQPDGKILIGGGFSTISGVARRNIARLNTDGTLDLTFDPNANDRVWSIVVQANGKILVGGEFTSIGGQTRNGIARLDATTGLADSFDPNAIGPFPQVQSIAVQADGKVLACGGFNTIGGLPRLGIARLDAFAGLPDSFDPHASNSSITIAVQMDGKILVGGTFFGANSIGGQTRNYFARLDPTTALADSFDPNPNGWVSSIVLQPNGSILAAGWFSDFSGGSIGGQPRNHIARLDPKTGLADSFNPNANNVVESMAVQTDGKIVVGGQFTRIGGAMRSAIGRVNGTTGLADSFDPYSNDIVSSVVLQADGKVLAGGSFAFIGGSGRSDFARLSNDTAALQDLAVTQTAITWARGGSSPQLTHVTFEYSTDNVNYAPLGNGTPAGSNWVLTALSLPTGQNFYIRARGYYRSGYGNGSGSITESVRNAFLARAAQALNFSTRMRVQTGDNVGIGGFIIAGTSPKHVLLRAIGPSLAQSGVPDVLTDPVLELHGPGAFVTITNDNWRDDPTQETAIIATGIPPTNDLESAIDATLNPGAYTAIVRGKNNTSGVALVEAYDLSQFVLAKLANISTRTFVSTGDNIVIAGFMLGNNNGNDRIVVRGMGPSLTAAGIPNALADPTLELRNSNGALLVANNDWQDDPVQAAELTAAGLAPTNQLESGIAATLPPGLYTALLAGLNDGTGIGLVEVYDRGAP